MKRRLETSAQKHSPYDLIKGLLIRKKSISLSVIGGWKPPSYTQYLKSEYIRNKKKFLFLHKK